MDTKKLRQKILDLAIRGKLVPQDPNDEPASVLLERIRAEKERLVKEGKIKRSKQKTSDKPHYENVPYEIPESWEWVRFGDISEVVRGGSPRPAGSAEFYDGNIPFLKVADLTKDNEVYVNSAENSIKDAGLTKTRFVKSGTLLLTNSGATLGVPKITNIDTTFNDGIAAFLYLDKNIKLYSYWYLRSQTINLRAINQGAGQPNLNTDLIKNLLIPLPPTEEQVRIVSAIENMFLLLDHIETAKLALNDTIQALKSKILYYAINGKLVPQNSDDTPAIELLQTINHIIQPCDTSHYPNLPSNWGLSTIKDLCTVISGLWKGKNPPFVNIGVIRNTNFSKDFRLDISDVAYLDVEQKQFEKRRLIYGDLILEKSGGSEKQPVGRTILYDKTDGEFSFSNFTAVLRINNKTIITPQYLYFALLNAYLNGATRMMQKQTTGIRNLIMERYLAITIPIPPIHEQERIVQSLENIYKIIDTINAEL